VSATNEKRLTSCTVACFIFIAALASLSSHPKLIRAVFWLDLGLLVLLIAVLLVDFYLFTALKIILSCLTPLDARFGIGLWFVVITLALVATSAGLHFMLARSKSKSGGGDVEGKSFS
jgi:hypothetical protein